MHFFAEYGLFLAKTFTLAIAILFVFFGIIAITIKGKGKANERLVVKNLNKKFQEMKNTLDQAVLTKPELKQIAKEEKLAEKAKKTAKNTYRKKIYVLDFHGDIKASAVKNLREEITAILSIATRKDEVLINLESQGGMVHAYGLAASQLQRIRQSNIPLTVTIDKVAASGGYLMACVANHILATPFAIVGSIGVIAQLPNFNRLLKKNDIDFEQIMAGEYKRTVSIFGKITDKGRKKFQEEIEDVHEQFKEFVEQNRPQLDIDQVATGEHWHGTRALELKLVDALVTSDDYLLNASKTSDIYKVCYAIKKPFAEKMSLTAQSTIDKVMQSWRQQNQESQLL